MEIHEEQRGASQILKPLGRIDSNTAPEFEKGLIGKVQEGHTDIVLDFSSLDYISSAGLRVLLMAAKRVKPKGGRVAICAMHAHIEEVFRVSGFLPLFQVHASLDDAFSG